MKSLKKLSVLALSAVFLCSFAACSQTPAGTSPTGGVGVSDGQASYTDPNSVVSVYDNKSYNEYLLGEKAVIANQWQGYGIGDPFVMRYNGAYYLYVSTLDSEIGVRGYKSADLVNWVPMTGSGLKEGYVSQDTITLAAYAPEVYYFNGTFYMYTSPGGRGHYVLTADSPEGPFVKATENFGMNIDGSVLIDDDEQMYFTAAASSDNPGILMARMTDMLHIDDGTRLVGVGLGGWTEGPYVLKRDGRYYLTYTGNHVASDGYRIAYATADSLPKNYRNAFTAAQNNPIALGTETELKGIGHSSTVMGPDMDSYYLVYHYLNSSGGPNRSLGIDRLTFNGSMMSVAPTLENSVKPALPAFYANGSDADKFDAEGSFLLSKTSAPAEFSAEYNLTGAEVSVYVFGYADANNYMDVTVDLRAKTVKLNKTVNGKTDMVGSGTLVNDFLAEKLHTVRVAARGGKVDVSFDNLTKIDDAELTVPAGKIGYQSLAAGAGIGYTAYSNVAMGMSDEAEAKQAAGYTGADNYLRGQTYTKAPVLGQGSGVQTVTEEDDYRLAGWKRMTLNNSGDSVSYLVYNGTAGRYGLELVYPASDGGKKIGVKVDGVNGGTVYRCTLPEIETESDTEYVRAVVGEFTLAKGARIVRLENVGSAVTYTAFRFTESAAMTPSFEANLSNYVERGADYKTIWKIKDGGHYAKAGTRQLVYFGDNTITDFTLEVDMKLEGSTGSSTAGIVFRAKNYASSPHDNYMSLQGYYLKINNHSVALEKLNYADGSGPIASNGQLKFESDKYYRIKIETRGNRIKVWVDDRAVFDEADGWNFANGKVGFYTDGAAAIFKNLKISG